MPKTWHLILLWVEEREGKGFCPRPLSPIFNLGENMRSRQSISLGKKKFNLQLPKDISAEKEHDTTMYMELKHGIRFQCTRELSYIHQQIQPMNTEMSLHQKVIIKLVIEFT